MAAVLLPAVCHAAVLMTTIYRWMAAIMVNNLMSLDQMDHTMGPIATSIISTAADRLAPSTNSRVITRWTEAVARQAVLGVVDLAAGTTNTVEQGARLLPLLTTVATAVAAI